MKYRHQDEEHVGLVPCLKLYVPRKFLKLFPFISPTEYIQYDEAYILGNQPSHDVILPCKGRLIRAFYRFSPHSWNMYLTTSRGLLWVNDKEVSLCGFATVKAGSFLDFGDENEKFKFVWVSREKALSHVRESEQVQTKKAMLQEVHDVHTIVTSITKALAEIRETHVQEEAISSHTRAQLKDSVSAKNNCSIPKLDSPFKEVGNVLGTNNDVCLEDVKTGTDIVETTQKSITNQSSHSNQHNMLIGSLNISIPMKGVPATNIVHEFVLDRQTDSENSLVDSVDNFTSTTATEQSPVVEEPSLRVGFDASFIYQCWVDSPFGTHRTFKVSTGLTIYVLRINAWSMHANDHYSGIKSRQTLVTVRSNKERVFRYHHCEPAKGDVKTDNAVICFQQEPSPKNSVVVRDPTLFNIPVQLVEALTDHRSKGLALSLCPWYNSGVFERVNRRVSNWRRPWQSLLCDGELTIIMSLVQHLIVSITDISKTPTIKQRRGKEWWVTTTPNRPNSLTTIHQAPAGSNSGEYVQPMNRSKLTRTLSLMQAMIHTRLQ